MKRILLIAFLLVVLSISLLSCGDEPAESSSQDSSAKATDVTTQKQDGGILPTSVSLSREELVLYVGSGYQVTAKVTPDNATNRAVTYTSSAPDCVTVSSDGVVSALKTGTAKIKATCHNGVEDTLTVTVIDESDEAYYFYSNFSADEANPDIAFSHSTNARYEIEDGMLHLITDRTDYINGKITFDNGVDGYLVAEASVAVQTNAFSNLFYFYTSDSTTDGVVCSVAAENGQFMYHNGSSWTRLESCALDVFYEIKVILRIGDRAKDANKGCFDISINGKWYRDLPLRHGGDGVEDSIRTFFFGSNKPDTHMVYDYLYLKNVKQPFVFLPQNEAALDLRSSSELKLDYELDGTPTPEVTLTCSKQDGWSQSGDVLTFTKAGIYEFNLTATNAYGSDSETLTVTVSDAEASPELTVRENQKTLAFKEGVTYTLDYSAFLGIPEGKKTITCNKNDGFTLNGDTVTFSKAGEYVFTVTLENALGKVSETITVSLLTECVVYEESFDQKPEDAKLTQTGSGKVAFENGLYKVTTGSGSC